MYLQHTKQMLLFFYARASQREYRKELLPILLFYELCPAQLLKCCSRRTSLHSTVVSPTGLLPTLLGVDGAIWPGGPVRGVSSSAGAGAAMAYDKSVSVLAGLWKYSVEFQTSYETGCYTLEYPKKIIIEYISPKVESKLNIVNMGSVRHRFDEVRHDCNVVLVGDVRVGKSALVNRFIHNKFQEVRRVYF